jgi:hypothetical protein
MSLFLIGQLVGGVAVFISLAVYQINNRTKMLQLSTVSAAMYGLLFFFLHAYTGAALNLIGAIRCYAFIGTRSTKSSLRIFLLFAVASCLATILTWVGPISLLALLGTLFSGMASGQLNSKNIRRVALLAPPLWFSYNFLTHSYPGMFIEIFVICSNIIGQYRFDAKSSSFVQK